MLVEVVEYLIKSLVNEPDLVSVKQFDDEDSITIEVMVSSDDMGRVIGRDGKVASAIRTFIRAVAYHQNMKKVNINIDSF